MTKNDQKEKHDTDKKDQDTERSLLKQKVADLENNYKRALADYQNLEKRVREEKSNWIKVANKELLLRILPILDTLLFASVHSKDQSLTVSIQQFLDVLKSEGVERVKTVGEEFDPRTMECVVTEEGEDGKVLEELRSGYMLGEHVLRPAQVKVGKSS